jgi:DNA modification methylase
VEDIHNLNYFEMIEVNRIYNENNLITMGRMPDCFIDLTVTSPPYDNLREYNGYDFNFEEVAKELFRVTKEGGVVVWVVGDETVEGSETGTSFRQALFFMSCGFNLHDTMIYEKTPSYPSGEKSIRYSQSFEYMFILSKGKPKTFNLISDRINRWGGLTSFGTQSEQLKDGTKKIRKKIQVKETGVRYNIWNYATGKGFSSKDETNHPAVFPELLARDHIYSWSNKGDLVYDPCMGSGTVAKMAHLQGRNWIGSEISKEYCDRAEKRIAPSLQLQKLF